MYPVIKSQMKIDNMKVPYISLCFFLFISVIFCSCIKEKNFEYSEITPKQISDFDPEFKEYCNLELSGVSRYICIHGIEAEEVSSKFLTTQKNKDI